MGCANNPFVRLLKIYAFDWVCVVVLFVIVGVLEIVEPFQRVYFTTDATIQYPHLPKETFPTWTMAFLAFALPIVVILTLSLTYRRSSADLHQALLGLLMSLAITMLITQAVKLTVGGLRPDFIDRCKPVDRFPPEGQTMNVRCTGDPSEIQEGRKSFPSGHSSTAFAGLGFLSFYLSGKLRAFTGTAYMWKFVAVVAPLILALLIALSRISDYMHNWWDVLIGGSLGLIVALICYRLLYPPISSARCGVPQGDRVARVLKRETPNTMNTLDSVSISDSPSMSTGSQSLPLTVVSTPDPNGQDGPPKPMSLHTVVTDKKY